MKDVKRIIAKISANAKRIKAIKEELDNTPWSEKKQLPLYEEESMLKLENMILKDNARNKLYHLIAPFIIEALEKYNNKPYGEKTRERISQEIESKTACRVYFSSDGATIYPSTKEYGYLFRYNDFDIYTRYDKKANDRIRILKDNKIQAISQEDIYLSCCREYVKNPKAKAKRITKAFCELKEKEKQFDNACKEFNELLPSNIDSVHPNRFRSYLY